MEFQGREKPNGCASRGTVDSAESLSERKMGGTVFIARFGAMGIRGLGGARTELKCWVAGSMDCAIEFKLLDALLCDLVCS